MFLLNQSTHRMVIRYDPDVGHIYVPNLKARIPGEDGGYFIITNSSGFRSNFEYDKLRRSQPRILIFGDSYTAGDDVCNEDRYSDVLGMLLGAETQNYGIPGTGTDQHLLIYRKFAKDVEADLLIICVQIDSFHRIQVSHRPVIDRITHRKLLVPKPYFEMANGDLVLRHWPVPIERLPAGDDGFPSAGTEEPWHERAARWSRRVPGLRALRHAGPFQELGSRAISEVQRLWRLHPYPDINSPETPGWKLMEAILRKFIQEARVRPIVIVPIPTKEFYVHGVKPIYQDLFARLEDRAAGIYVADVSTVLANLPWSMRQKLRYEFGAHFTPFANGLVAEKMAEFIRTRKLLQGTNIGDHQMAMKSSHALAPRKQQSTLILGISCFYHNSAASIIRDGDIVAAAEEERFTRVKNDRRFPRQAINYCLEEASINPKDLTSVAYYDNSALTFERILHSLMAVDRGAAKQMWMRIMPSWLRLKLHFSRQICGYLRYQGPVLQGIHHRSHAASCFFASPFDRAALLTIDGVGEWATAAIGQGSGNQVRLLREMRFPHSLGMLYSSFTQFTGFKVNSGEYKMMGLAPYGRPCYTQKILDTLIDLKEDGSLELNLEYFGFLRESSMTTQRFAELFGGPPRAPESRITQREMDLARSIQVVTEEALLRMARTAHKITGEQRLCLAGGVALNCVANGRLLREGPYQDLWIQPAAGDAGCAVGVALDAYHTYFGKARVTRPGGRANQDGSYWGPEFSEDEIQSYLDTFGYPYHRCGPGQRPGILAQALADGKIVGHLAGRLEFGPRALGARSILGDPRDPAMQAELNLRIKYRESFRPFAPAVLAESVGEYFELDRESPYMLLVAAVRKERRLSAPAREAGDDEDLLPVVRQARSDIPAVTHVDYSARVQTVRREDHREFYDVIDAFRQRTGCAVVVNTSFNVRGEPIVCTPQDAYRCFMRTEMDMLALGNFVLVKSEQPAWPEGRGEGLESEDVSAATLEKHPERLLRRIRRLFDTTFWPAAQRLREQRAVLIDTEFKRVPSLWVDTGEPQDLRTVFELPEPLRVERPEPTRFADALTSQWLSQSTAPALKPVIAELVKAGLKCPASDDLGESVSESVYVMF